MRTRGLAVLSAAAFILAGCSGDEPTEPEDTATSPTDEEAASPDEDAGAATETEDVPADDDTAPDDAGDDTTGDAATAEPLASAETTWSGGSGDGPVRLDLLEVTRRGEDFMEVRFSLTSLDDGDRMVQHRLNDQSRTGFGDRDLSGITVEDVDAGERLLVLRDSDGTCVCSTTDTGQWIPPDTPRIFFARFPAPVSDRVDVAIPTFGVFNDVPVS